MSTSRKNSSSDEEMVSNRSSSSLKPLKESSPKTNVKKIKPLEGLASKRDLITDEMSDISQTQHSEKSINDRIVHKKRQELIDDDGDNDETPTSSKSKNNKTNFPSPTKSDATSPRTYKPQPKSTLTIQGGSNHVRQSRLEEMMSFGQSTQKSSSQSPKKSISTPSQKFGGNFIGKTSRLDQFRETAEEKKSRTIPAKTVQKLIDLSDDDGRKRIFVSNYRPEKEQMERESDEEEASVEPIVIVREQRPKNSLKPLPDTQTQRNHEKVQSSPVKKNMGKADKDTIDSDDSVICSSEDEEVVIPHMKPIFEDDFEVIPSSLETKKKEKERQDIDDDDFLQTPLSHMKPNSRSKKTKSSPDDEIGLIEMTSPQDSPRKRLRSLSQKPSLLADEELELSATSKKSQDSQEELMGDDDSDDDLIGLVKSTSPTQNSPRKRLRTLSEKKPSLLADEELELSGKSRASETSQKSQKKRIDDQREKKTQKREEKKKKDKRQRQTRMGSFMPQLVLTSNTNGQKDMSLYDTQRIAAPSKRQANSDEEGAPKLKRRDKATYGSRGKKKPDYQSDRSEEDDEDSLDGFVVSEDEEDEVIRSDSEEEYPTKRLKRIKKSHASSEEDVDNLLENSEENSMDESQNSMAIYSRSIMGDEEKGVLLDSLLKGVYSDEDSYKVYIQWIVCNLLDPDFSEDLGVKERAYFKPAVDKIENTIIDRQNFVRGSVWYESFARDLDAYPIYSSWERSSKMVDCEACNKSGHPATFDVILSGQKYDAAAVWKGKEMPPEPEEESGKRKTYALGRYCYARSQLYHRLQHWKYHIYSLVRKKLSKYKAEDEANEIVDRVMADERWLGSMSLEYQDILGAMDDFKGDNMTTI
ncbi:hypothetical protein PROFUN_00142 [Planoprotostelium fungivorum]|uniref:DUF4211 domain-containing protein n=1 Tax=Planoprotostelium fungivorum TaxID=1890364 RepID=A0A2P6P0S6_9EUKA|nr:hypothetical protein PROFUN_00142 [Planoprotostelium fungivorum]